MCVAVDQATERLKNTRDNVNSLFGWGNPGTRGEEKRTINIYNRLPGGDIENPTNRNTLQSNTSNGGKK
tara:strand:- start:490 stop:696 length:207 start_codon:yes stop_codon:yes gene_type:complete